MLSALIILFWRTGLNVKRRWAVLRASSETALGPDPNPFMSGMAVVSYQSYALNAALSGASTATNYVKRSTRSTEAIPCLS